MPKRGRRKTDEDFFNESIKFFIQNGANLKNIFPDTVDEYNDHSLLKLVSITYWVGIFSPIAHKQLKERHDYKVVYVDTMAGSGVTKTKREGDCFCGSCTGAVLSARKKGFPFDKVIAVEIDSKKARVLEKRLESIDPDPKKITHDKDISQVSSSIIDEIKERCVSYIVIDPEGFEGMSWNSIGPLLSCKGDAMITWFEMDAWRMRGRAISDNKAACGNADRLTELLGSEKWRNVSQPVDMTNIFIDRILKETGKGAAECINIEDSKGKHYKMILFVGRCRNSKDLATKWKENMERRLGSSKGRNIAALLDTKTGRIRDLRHFIPDV